MFIRAHVHVVPSEDRDLIAFVRNTGINEIHRRMELKGKGNVSRWLRGHQGLHIDTVRKAIPEKYLTEALRYLSSELAGRRTS